MINKLAIINGNLIIGNIIIKKNILIDGKIISDIISCDYDIPDDYYIIDANNNYISPGFIDLHCHGGGNSDFSDNTKEAFINIATTHLKHGTTSMLATTLSNNPNDLDVTLNLFNELKKIDAIPSIIGLHLEGPYFAVNQKGAQDERYIKNPDKTEYENIIKKCPHILRWSIAPELVGAKEMGTYLTKNNILASIAHTEATYGQVLEAFYCGYTHITHFYSCMSTIKRENGYRTAGVLESGYIIDDMTVEIIADGSHIPPPLLKLVYKQKGAAKIALCTDSMRAAGYNCTESILGSLTDGIKVLIEDNFAKLCDRTAFAGSVATADTLVYNMIALADVLLCDAVAMMTSTPASILNLNNKGTLDIGYDADILIFSLDNKLDIKNIILQGKLIKN